MISIFHGDNQVASRQALLNFLQKKPVDFWQKIDASKLEIADVESALASESLFADEQGIVFEGLLSLIKSKKKDSLLELIRQSEKPLVLWDGKKIPVTTLKKFPNAQIQEFPISQQLWKFLDELGSKSKVSQLRLFHEICQREAAEFIFVMVQRQIRLLLAVQLRETASIPAFQLRKLQSQTKRFTLEKLLHAHEKLYQIDQKNKQSKSLLSLQEQLDLWLIAL